MLDFLRKKKRSWVILIMIGVIVLVFALYFGSGSLQQDPMLGGHVAEVNGDPISARDLELRFMRLMRLNRNRSQDIDNLNLRIAILDDLIQSRLLVQEAQRLGLEVADQELSDAIAANPVFQSNGRFNKDFYLRVLNTQRITPAQFEQEVREELLTQKLFDIIRDSVRVTEAEVREQYRIENEKLNLNFIRLARSDYLSKVEVSPEEVKAYYEQNQEALTEPTKVRVEYIAYPYEHFASKIQVSPKEIEDYYNLYRESKFHQKEAVKLRHILFRLPAEADAETTQEVRAKAEAVHKEAAAGKDFAELAEKHSKDPSAARGGEVGLVSKGELLPELEEAAFRLEKGDISDLVKTSLGFHIIKVEDVREEKTQTLEEAEAEIIRALRKERGPEQALRAADSDRQKARDGAGLNVLAEERGLQGDVTPFFQSGERIEGIGPVDAFYTTAFDLSPGGVSSVVEGPEAAYLIKLRDRKEAHLPPFEAIHDEVTRRVKEKKAMETANEKGTELLAELKETKDIQQLAKKHGLSVEGTGFFSRSTTRIPKIGFLDDMGPGGIPLLAGRPVPDRLYRQEDAVYLLAFKESQEADMKAFDKEKALLMELALEHRRQRALRQFVQGLRARANIRVETDSLPVG